MVLHYPAQKVSQMDSMFTLLILEKNHASEIEQNVNDIIDYTQYLSTPITETRLQFKCNTDDTQKAIDRLENKTSSEHDGISNKLLKLLKMELSKSLTLIINQMITGIFPDSFKISKITLLFKKGDVSLLSN